MGRTGVRIFGGDAYAFDGTWQLKKHADSRAEWLRRKGQNVRITKGKLKVQLTRGQTDFTVWRIWKRPKGKRRRRR